MKTVIIIPARYASTRLPGKPLHPILGTAMIERVVNIAHAVEGVDEVIVATDDERIVEFVASFGGTAVMTSPECKTGTDRVWEAIKARDNIDIVVNLQGDAVLTPPHVIESLVHEMQSNEDVVLATPATLMNDEAIKILTEAKRGGEASGTTVVFDKNMNAMYFSKQTIPFTRETKDGRVMYRHIGLYAYRYETLKTLHELPQGTFEKLESLEQLRALENGIPIKVVIVDYQGRTHWGVDSPEDVTRVESLIEQEGELL